MSSRLRLRRLVIPAGVLFFILLFVLPVLWMALASLMTKEEVTSRPQVYLPAAPQLTNYLSFFKQGVVGNEATIDIAFGLRNSLVVAIVVTLLNLVFGSMAGYSLARTRTVGSHALLLFYLVTRMLPTVSLMIPLYVTFRTLGLLDTQLGLIIAYMPYTLPFTIWMLTSYFRLIPSELDQAALVDGCNRFTALVRVILPVSTPALISAGIFAFVSAWSEFLLAVILTRSTDAATITVAAANFGNNIFINYNLLAAAGILALVPPVVLSLVFQRYITSGLAAGAVQ